MNARFSHTPLDLSKSFLDNIDKRKFQNDNENKLNAYENSHINPPFRYYKDDINMTATIAPNIVYKSKSLYEGSQKPIQTEHDAIGINDAFLNSYYGYKDYGYFNVQHQSLPENHKHKIIPKNNMYQLV